MVYGHLVRLQNAPIGMDLGGLEIEIGLIWYYTPA